MIHEKRIRIVTEGQGGGGPVVYWMSRDQRVQDNWGLLYAQETALRIKKPLAVVFCVVPQFLGATIRQYSFMLKGLQQGEEGLAAKNIPFHLLMGPPEEEIPKFIKKNHVGSLVTDFDPLRIKRSWKAQVAQRVHIPFHEVDAHNIIPCWVASPKQEYAAYTFRPKIQKMLPEFLTDFPKLKKHPFSSEKKREKTDWDMPLRSLKVDTSVHEIDWMKSGEKAAQHALRSFLEKRLSQYDEKRNNPAGEGQSNLSPYLHFGQLSAQRVALEIQQAKASRKSKEPFLEELIVRRELSDNFCFYNSSYDSFDAFPKWAQETLDKHQKDRREHLYTLEELESGLIHDELWNAAQMEMVRRGKMHGYMRMYWAKKILEWTKSPEKALEIAIYLNDKYELDGRDPNGYTGVAWSIGGVHDRAWNERPIFGKIRYMSYNGCKAKFDVKAYVRKVQNL